jgi:hypothetical protein
MDLDKIKLSSNQEIRDINVEPADNGGVALRFSIYTPSLRNSESVWDSRTEVFPEDKVETEAMDRIVELYKLDIANKKAKKSGSVNKNVPEFKSTPMAE